MTVPFLLPHLEHTRVPPHEALKFAFFERRRDPTLDMLRLIKTEQLMLHLRGRFGPQHFALAECLRPAWIDNGDPIATIMEMVSKSFPIRIGRLHASFNCRHLAIAQPSVELGEAFRRVWEVFDSVFLFVNQKSGVKSEL